MKKKLLSAILLAALAVSLLVPAAFAAPKQSDSDDVIEITIVIGNPTKEEIENHKLDDGTRVGDHEYIVRYAETALTKAPPDLLIYFKYAYWTKDTGVLSLALNPKMDVRTNYDAKEAAWDILTDPENGIVTSSYWPTEPQKEKTFRWQYDCHYIGGMNEEEWNLEPHRSASNFFAVLLAKCNP